MYASQHVTLHVMQTINVTTFHSDSKNASVYCLSNYSVEHFNLDHILG